MFLKIFKYDTMAMSRDVSEWSNMSIYGLGELAL
jgi:hypothetical protein